MESGRHIANPTSTVAEYRLVFPNLPDTRMAIADDVLGLVAQLDKLFPNPSYSFGMDQKVQYHVETSASEHQSRKVFYRVPQEPATLGTWARLARFDFTMGSALEFASLLCGKETSHRVKDIWATGDDNTKTLFEELGESGSWLESISKIRSMAYHPLIEAITCYARVVFYHPFRDGNGRFARALLYGSFARYGLLRSPCMGVAATFDLHRRNLAEATSQLSKSQDWESYFTTILDVLRTACEIAILIRRQELTNTL